MGLGWLGLTLAQQLRFWGYNVRGTVTTFEKSEALKQKGLDAYEVFVTEQGVLGNLKGFLEHLDIVVIMIPPGLRRHSGSDYVLKMSNLLDELESAGIHKCLFVSSTSVYGDDQGKVTESDAPRPDSEAGRQLLQVEQLFFMASFRTSIVRFGGLVGGSRQPVRFLAGRTELSGGKAPVNLIEREDCIGILMEIIQKDAFGHIFNAVHPSHPTKDVYYTEKALELGLPIPVFREEEETIFKEVHSQNVLQLLDYEFKKGL